MKENNFTDMWKLWYHHEKDNWKISGYRDIYKISTAEEFWKLYNNWDSIGGISNKHFFLMKNDIKPLWEDPNNINGGCWSFKLLESNAKELWEELSMLITTNSLLNKNVNDELVGLSICIKKNNYCVIKVWNKNSKNNSFKTIKKDILEKWGTDIIYIANMSEN